MGCPRPVSVALAAFYLMLIAQVSIANDCRMADFPVKSNFQPSQFAGKWYELKWIIEPWIPPAWNYLDFFQEFTLKGNHFDIFSLGRIKSGDPYCKADTPALFSTGENAKYLYDRKFNSTSRMNSTYWIIDTDYNNYALAYGCRELASNGTCVQPDCWLWSRRPSLEDNYLKTMEDQLPGLCITQDMLLVTKQEKECVPEPKYNKENKASNGASLNMHFVFTVMSTIAAISLKSCL